MAEDKKAREPKKKAPAKMGRPTKYTKDLADSICAEIASGKSLIKACAGKDMPEARTVYRWIREKPDFCLNYEFAKEDQADKMIEEIMDIGDKADSETVQVAKLKIDTRKWVASKFKQKRYGDKLQTDNVNHNLDYANKTDDEIDQMLSRLES